MKRMKLYGPTLLLALCFACGDNKPPPKKSGDWMDNLKPVNPGATSIVEDDPDPDPAPKPTSEKPGPDPSPAVKPNPKPGRPLIQYGPKSAIESTFGATPGAKLKLSNGPVLVIPEYSLDGGYNIVWKLTSKSPGKKATVAGKVAMLRISKGTKLKAKKVTSRGDAFQVRVDTGGAPSINLAVGSVETDKNGKETGKPSWAIIQPKKVNKAVSIVDGKESEEFQAVFELEAIGPVMYIHATEDAAG